MRQKTKLKKNLFALIFVMGLIILVYSGTSSLNKIMDNDPAVCNQTYFSIQDVCFNTEKNSYNNYHTGIDIKIQNKEMDINGFRIKVFSLDEITPHILFKTIKADQSAALNIPYDDDHQKIKKIEILPILNINQNIEYCGLKHGTIYEDKIGLCQ